MKKIDFKNIILPHIIALTVLFSILSVFFAPVYSGKTLVQNDIIQHTGAAKAINDFRDKHGEEPLWTNSLFGGMPAFMVSTRHTGEIFTSLIHTFRRALPEHINLLFIGGISFYILMIVAGFTPTISLTASISFIFSAYTLVSLEAGHNGKIETLAYSPLVLAGIYLVLKKDFIKGFIISLIGTTMFINSGHYQIMYYLFLGVGISSVYFIVKYIQDKDLISIGKIMGVFAIVILIAIGNNYSKLFTSLDYIQNHSTRGKKELKDNKEGATDEAAMDYDYAFAWSYGILESATLVIPYYYGGSSREDLGTKSATYEALKSNNVPSSQAKNFVANLPTYWGEQPFTSGPTYFGAVIILFFILAFVLWNSKLKWYLLGAIIFTWFLSLGKNLSSFNYFLFDNLPGMNKFRAVAMATSVTQLFVVIVAMTGIYLVYKNDEIDIKKVFKGIGISIGGVILLVLIGISQDFSGVVDAQLANQPGWILDAIREDRKNLLLSDAFRTLIFMALASIVIFLKFNKKITSSQFSIAILVFILIDLWGVSKRYINEDNFSKNTKESAFKITPADELILQDKDNFRVFNVSTNTFNENNTSYLHQSVGGYRPAKMQRYQDIIERHLSKNNMKVVDMLNTRYIIRGSQAKDVVKNPNALGNAWFIQNINSVNTPNEEIDALNKFNPKDEAIVDLSRFNISNQNFNGKGNIKLVDWDLNYLKYEYDASDDAFVVFSENYYDNGWVSTVDGNEKEHIRVNYILRGMEVPKGKHSIEFKFEPQNYYTNNKIASISSIISFLLIGFVAFIGLRKKATSSTDE